MDQIFVLGLFVSFGASQATHHTPTIALIMTPGWLSSMVVICLVLDRYCSLQRRALLFSCNLFQPDRQPCFHLHEPFSGWINGGPRWQVAGLSSVLLLACIT
jgi:hypothetical protein